jgi:hypothetical protein
MLASALFNVDVGGGASLSCWRDPFRRAGAWMSSGGSGGADEHAIDIAMIASVIVTTLPRTTKK